LKTKQNKTKQNKTKQKRPLKLKKRGDQSTVLARVSFHGTTYAEQKQIQGLENLHFTLLICMKICCGF